MLNMKLLINSMSSLIKIIEETDIPKEEKIFRRKQLFDTCRDIIKEQEITGRYYQLAHEIKSIELFKEYPNFQISLDYKNEPGADFQMFNNYNIECVCSSSGDEKNNGLINFHGSGVFDYNKKEQIIMTRLTSSIKEKKDFYNNHVDKGTMNENEPYIIFLSLGNLAYRSFMGKYGFSLNKILFGLGHLHLVFDKNNYKVIKTEFDYNNFIINHNNSKIGCNLFKEPDYNCISGILFTDAVLDEKYTTKNTFLFINPMAKNRINAAEFNKFVYWKTQKKDDKILYFPRYKGKNLNKSISSYY